jgi:hypothetical protein
LVDPTGTQVALPTEWESDFLEVTYYLRQVGECVWMTGLDETDDPDLPFVTQFVGRLGPDFRIVGEFADLTGELIIGWDHGSIAWQITFEDDAIVLIEDRSAEQPPGCIDSSAGACPDPRRLTAR